MAEEAVTVMAEEAVTVIDLDRCRPGDLARAVDSHRMRTTRYNLLNLSFYWGCQNLVSLWRFMKGTAPSHPDYSRLVDFYFSEFEMALGSVS